MMKPALPKVSVIIPSFNHARYIRECVESVLSQSYPEIEIVIIDDGSTDETIDILEEYGDRIRLIRQIRGRQARARNIGLKESSGEWIAFLDSDDRYLPSRIEDSVAAVLNDPTIDLVWGDFRIINANGRVIQEIRWAPSQPDFRLELISGNPICNASVTVKREALCELKGFDERVPRACDGLAWYRLAARGKRFAHVPRILLDYRIHNKNDAHAFMPMTRDRDLALTIAVPEYLEYGVIRGREQLRWLRNAVLRQFAFNTAAGVQTMLGESAGNRLAAKILSIMGSDAGLAAVGLLRRTKSLWNRLIRGKG